MFSLQECNWNMCLRYLIFSKFYDIVRISHYHSNVIYFITYVIIQALGFNLSQFSQQFLQIGTAQKI